MARMAWLSVTRACVDDPCCPGIAAPRSALLGSLTHFSHHRSRRVLQVGSRPWRCGSQQTVALPDQSQLVTRTSELLSSDRSLPGAEKQRWEETGTSTVPTGRLVVLDCVA